MSAINISYIADEVKRVMRKYDETDPFRLARAMKIIVSYESLGLYEGCCKGFFIVHRRMKHITINSDLPEELQSEIIRMMWVEDQETLYDILEGYTS